MPSWSTELLPIFLLLSAIAVVVWRLPHVELGHSIAYRRRRFLNWFPVGLTYAFLYMGRYNLTVCSTSVGDGMMSKDDFGTIFAWGAAAYGISFAVNGPLTDRWGGRTTIMISAVGSSVMNLIMGFSLPYLHKEHLVLGFSLLYGVNMYFQSFGAVSIVKLNAPWFHVRERGTFGAIFGILISLGIYFAFDWGGMIVKYTSVQWVFWTPSVILLIMTVFVFFLVRDSPAEAGFENFHPGDASAADGAPRLGLKAVAARMFRNPVIVIIALVEFCSGFLRQAVQNWYPRFAKETGQAHTFVAEHWGMMLCVAGILGGVIAGVISDHVFQSRRGPVSAVLYGAAFVGVGLGWAFIDTSLVSWLAIFLFLCIIGVHGMLSGTASMDFGGKQNTGVAVGIIDGFVYLGAALQARVLGWVLPTGAAKASAANWWTWLAVMLPVALVGMLLGLKLWNARPSRDKAVAPTVLEPLQPKVEAA